MRRVSDQTRAWNAGYIAGLDDSEEPCPFTDGPLRDQWYAGFFAGTNRAIANGFRKAPEGAHA